jgi:hypothetical protein
MTQLLNGLDETAITVAHDHAVAKEMADALLAHYPGHLWAVSADSSTGMCDIRNLLLSGEWGYRLKLPKIYSASAFRADVIRAGGEILERFRLARGRFVEDQYAGLKTTFSGDHAFDK